MKTREINFMGFCLTSIFIIFSTFAVAGNEITTVTPLVKSDNAVFKKQKSEISTPKTILHWKQIAPYVVMQKVCDDEKILLIYSELEDLILGTSVWDIYPREMVMVHQLTRKRAEIDSVISDQMIYRYVFCLDDSIQSFVIKNDEYESIPVDLVVEDLSRSRNLGLVLDADREYLDLKAAAIERAETQRSKSIEYLQPTIAEMMQDYQDAYANSQSNQYGNEDYDYGYDDGYGNDYTYNNVPNTSSSTTYVSGHPGNVGTSRNPSQGNTSNTTGGRNGNYMTSSQAKSVVISTIDDENIVFDESKIVLDGEGNGYTIQVIAKLKHDHTARTIQQYYNLPYAIQEHFDGTWHRFTLKGYSDDWDEMYNTLQEIRRIYGISDAFISLYQNHERVAIYPCSGELAEKASEYAENLELDNE